MSNTACRCRDKYKEIQAASTQPDAVSVRPSDEFKDGAKQELPDSSAATEEAPPAEEGVIEEVGGGVREEAWDFYSTSSDDDVTAEEEEEGSEELDPGPPAGVGAVRAHWALPQHCHTELYPCPLPALELPSRAGRLLLRRWHRCRRPDLQYTSQLTRTVMHTLLFLCVHDTPHQHFREMFMSELLLDMRMFDFASRKKFFGLAYHFFAAQSHLYCVCLDNARLSEMEAGALVCAMVDGAGRTMSELHLWNAVTDKEMVGGRPETTVLTGSLIGFQNLSMLSVNYSFIGCRANAMDVIASLIGDSNRIFILQLLCTSTKEGSVSDKKWHEVASRCTGLQVNMVIVMRPTYDDLRQFLCPHMPLAELCLVHVTDVSRNPWAWDTETLLKMVAKFYGNTLARLCLHISRPIETFRMSALFPHEGSKNRLAFYNLQVLELCSVFELRDVEVALRRALEINSGDKECRLEHLCIRLQVPYKYKWDEFTAIVLEMRQKYSERFKEIKIKFRLDVFEV